MPERVRVMIQRSATWGAIFKPGQAEDFFQPGPPGEFDPNVEGFSAINAWWLSEMARLVYRRDPGRGPGSLPTRGQILCRMGLIERETFRAGNLFAALIESAEGAARPPFGVLVFRGSSGHLDNWMANLDAKARPWPTGGKVHGGFKRSLLSLWPAILPVLRQCRRPIFYTGHSLGAALATLAASLRPPRAVYTFGSPRVGDRRFIRSLASLPVFRIANPRDIVTVLPPAGFPLGYHHAGEARPFGPEGYDPAPAAPPPIVNSPRWRGTRPRLLTPPVFLFDHAPVCYTDGLNEAFSSPS